MANYKFSDWMKINLEGRVIAPNVIEITHTDHKNDYSFVENLQPEDMIKFKRGLAAHIVQEASTSINDSDGHKVTTITIKPDSEMPVDWVNSVVVLTESKSKTDLNDICRIAAKALRGSNVNEIRAESYYILGRVYHLLSQFDNALKFYEDALALMPEMSLAAFGIGQLYLAKESFDLSYEKFQEVLKKYPDDRDTQAYILFIRAYHRKETSSFDKLKEIAPGFVFEADLWLAQGHAMHQKGPSEYAKSLKCYEMAYSVMQEQKLVPHHHVLLNMGVLYHAVGNLERAMHYTRLSLRACDRPFRENEQGEQVAVSPNTLFLEAENDVFFSWIEIPSLQVAAVPLPSTAAMKAKGMGGVLSSLSVGQGDVSSVEVGSYLLIDGVVVLVEEVNVAEKQFICRGMISLFSPKKETSTSLSVQKKTPGYNFNNDTIAHCFNLARIHEDKGETQAAMEVYKNLLAMHPSFLECYLRLSMISCDMGRKADAMKWIERGMALDSDNVDATVVFGDLYCQMEDWDHAKVKFEKICKERHHDARTFLSLGNLYFANISSKESCLKDSLKFYHVVLKEDPRNIYALNGLGMICAMEGKSDVARDIFSRGRETKILPPSTDIVTNLGHVHMQQGRNVEAIRIYENVLKMLPNMPCSTHGSHGASNIVQPNRTPTLRHLPTASYMAVSDCLSLAHFKHKQHEDAVKVQLKSLHLDPSQSHVWYNLAYTKEEFAVASLLKAHKTATDIEYAIGEIDKAQQLFAALSKDSFLSGVPKHRRYDPVKAEEHASFCDENLEKFRHHLEKVQEQEDRKKEERSLFLAEQMSRAEEKERAKKEAMEEQNRLKALRLEKAKQKQAILEETWQSTVGAQQDADATDKKSKKKKGGKRGADEEGESEEPGVSALLDRMDDDSSGDEQEVQAMFDSDEEDEKEQDVDKNGNDEDKVKDVFGSDSSDDEEEFNAEADSSAPAKMKTNQGGRLKRSLDSSDDEGELDLTGGDESNGNVVNGDEEGSTLQDEDGSDGPARQRRKVIADDDEEED